MNLNFPLNFFLSIATVDGYFLLSPNIYSMRIFINFMSSYLTLLELKSFELCSVIYYHHQHLIINDKLSKNMYLLSYVRIALNNKCNKNELVRFLSLKFFSFIYLSNLNRKLFKSFEIFDTWSWSLFYRLISITNIINWIKFINSALIFSLNKIKKDGS